MNEITAWLSELSKSIKAPKYLVMGLVLLFTALVLMPLLKMLAIAFAVLLIFIGFNPEHEISKQALSFINKLK